MISLRGGEAGERIDWERPVDRRRLAADLWKAIRPLMARYFAGYLILLLLIFGLLQAIAPAAPPPWSRALLCVVCLPTLMALGGLQVLVRSKTRYRVDAKGLLVDRRRKLSWIGLEGHVPPADGSDVVKLVPMRGWVQSIELPGPPMREQVLAFIRARCAVTRVDSAREVAPRIGLLDGIFLSATVIANGSLAGYWASLTRIADGGHRVAILLSLPLPAGIAAMAWVGFRYPQHRQLPIALFVVFWTMTALLMTLFVFAFRVRGLPVPP